ncbi:hypothetical protein DPMN_076791, partial [Dreissena polymorpha]
CGNRILKAFANSLDPDETPQNVASHLDPNLDDLLHELSAGDDLNKIKGGGILYTRHFCLDSKSLRLYYTGSEKRFRKKNTSWPLSSIEEVREGEKDYAKRLDHHDVSTVGLFIQEYKRTVLCGKGFN